MSLHRPLVLASTSVYRRELLGRLGLAFDVASPGVDETPRAGETPAQLVERLALAKAEAVAERRPDAVVIGSDQVADLDGRPIGKPGSHGAAVAQLRSMSGKALRFHTGVAVVCRASGYVGRARVPVEVVFRTLDDAAIEHYLQREPAYDCAGSAKSEGLGIALMEAIRSDDPTALVGLPLIRTAALLREAGVDPLAAPIGAANSR
jgi:septum formation protein